MKRINGRKPLRTLASRPQGTCRNPVCIRTGDANGLANRVGFVALDAKPAFLTQNLALTGYGKCPEVMAVNSLYEDRDFVASIGKLHGSSLSFIRKWTVSPMQRHRGAFQRQTFWNSLQIQQGILGKSRIFSSTSKALLSQPRCQER